MKKGLLLLNLILSFMGVGQIWQVQLSSYPLWAYVGTNELHNYHIAWWHSIWIPLFIPAGLAMICTIGLFWFRPPTVLRSSVWTAIILLLITYVLTFIWWAPLMALIGATPQEFHDVFNWAPLLNKWGIQTKTQKQLFDLLIITHWLRVALLSAYGILMFRMTIVGLDLKKPTVRISA